MRTLPRCVRCFCFLLLACFATLCHAAGVPGEPVVDAAPVPTVVERGPHHRVWQRDKFQTLADGRTINQPSRIVDLASGLHYWENQQWNESRSTIDIVADGAAATHSAHKIHFAVNLNTVGAITLTTPDNKTLRSHVLGLTYTSLENGQCAWIARLRNSEGVLSASNEVLYANAFSNIVADVRYLNSRAGLEQDVILRERLPSPLDSNLDPETALLEVWTEFVEAPEPVKAMRTRIGITDTALDFGAMRMTRGSAFALAAPVNRLSGAVVGKTWLVDPNSHRTFLIESVRYKTIKTELDQLPAPQAALSPIRGLKSRDETLLALLGEQRTTNTASKPMQLAFQNKALDPRKGLVLDYVLVSANTNLLTLAADTTYNILGEIYVDDLVIEGNTVVKFSYPTFVAPSTCLFVDRSIDCQTIPYRPAIFTGIDDNSVGEIITGSTGNPTPAGYAFAALQPNVSVDLHDMRFSYLNWGMILFLDSRTCSSPTALRPSTFRNAHSRSTMRCSIATAMCSMVAITRS
jgi:hypothetical protein